MFLPPCALYVSPIELVFAELKSFLRGASAGTEATLRQAIGRGLVTVTSDHVQAYCRLCGYPLPDEPSQPS